MKNQYIEHKEIMAAQGVKIAARDPEKTIAGLSMRVANNPDEVEVLREAAERDLASALNAIKFEAFGSVCSSINIGISGSSARVPKDIKDPLRWCQEWTDSQEAPCWSMKRSLLSSWLLM